MPIVCPGLCYWTHVECIYKSQFLSAYLILHGCDQLVKSKLKNDERLSIAALNTLNTATPATVGCSPSRIFCSTLQKHVGIRKPFLAGFHTRKLLKEVPARRACHLSQLGPKKKIQKGELNQLQRVCPSCDQDILPSKASTQKPSCLRNSHRDLQEKNTPTVSESMGLSKSPLLISKMPFLNSVWLTTFNSNSNSILLWYDKFQLQWIKQTFVALRFDTYSICLHRWQHNFQTVWGRQSILSSSTTGGEKVGQRCVSHTAEKYRNLNGLFCVPLPLLHPAPLKCIDSIMCRNFIGQSHKWLTFHAKACQESLKHVDKLKQGWMLCHKAKEHSKICCVLLSQSS